MQALRTLEHIPSGYFEVRLNIEFGQDVYEQWAKTALLSWNPKNLEKTDESETSSIIVYSNREAGSGWPGDYCTMRAIPGSKTKKAHLTVNWTPGNRGTIEAFQMFDKVLDLAGANVAGDFYVGDDGYGLEFKGKLTNVELRALLGTRAPEWKIPDVQEKALEYFIMEITETAVIFKVP